MELLIRNHPFVDGNKRTGATAAGIFLRRNGYHLTANNTDLAIVTMSIAQSKGSLEELTIWLGKNSQPIK